MSQGNDFANYTAATTGSTGSEDLWFVAVASDDIKQMNVDQLDEAFRLGIITADTAVWTEGMEAWQPLGQVADLDADSEGSSEASGSHAAVGSHAMSSHAPRESAHSSSAASFGGSFGSVTLQSAQHSYAPGPNSVAPVTSSYAPTGMLGQSTSPVALHVDEDVPPMRQGRRFRPERWALAAAALAAVGVVAYNNMFSSSVASAGTQAPAPTALAARPYDGVEPGEKLNAKAAATEEAEPRAVAKAAEEPSISPVAAAAAAAVPAAKAAVMADDEDEAPSSNVSSKARASDKEGLRGSFSKAFNNKKEKASARTSRVKPRKATRAATKSRATKAKKSGVVRTQSAFDPLNDSLP